ncbi:multifunctional methyltransferase subunit TRM112-like protein isoform X3 [Capricornis sumatraensis]|uniref:multifunctional methyltransferase subunit TRM112-like protein isoform X3 n=1 Tax=Capricornis sumatraensis TaxID=34865 RepID=UPI003605171B
MICNISSAKTTGPAPLQSPAETLPGAAHDTNQPPLLQAPEARKVLRFRSSQASNRIERDSPGNDLERDLCPSGSGCAGARSADMRLLTHNLLSSHVRGVGPRGFPLRLQATEVRINPVEFNPDFIVRMIPKVEWAALLEAADNVPKEPIQGYEHNEEFLRKMHHVLLEVEVLEGTLQCPESGRVFPISRGIPNMLLSDEETET